MHSVNVKSLYGRMEVDRFLPGVNSVVCCCFSINYSVGPKLNTAAKQLERWRGLHAIENGEASINNLVKISKINIISLL